MRERSSALDRFEILPALCRDTVLRRRARTPVVFHGAAAGARRGLGRHQRRIADAMDQQSHTAGLLILDLSNPFTFAALQGRPRERAESARKRAFVEA
jgi:hypothetical protein